MNTDDVAAAEDSRGVGLELVMTKKLSFSFTTSSCAAVPTARSLRRRLIRRERRAERDDACERE